MDLLQVFLINLQGRKILCLEDSYWRKIANNMQIVEGFLEAVLAMRALQRAPSARGAFPHADGRWPIARGG
ncbi:hypothetical protein ACCD01_30820, partial [Telluria sp. Tellsp99]